jgi:crossover junction endodeoxyribonuclease RuvC
VLLIGIDPGAKGGLAMRDTTSRRIVHAQRMPTYKRVVSGKERLTVDAYGVLDVLRMWHGFGAEMVCMELVSGIIGQSAHGAFTFGEGVGVVFAAAASCGYRIERVAAVVWKPEMKAPKDKKQAVRRASELCPEGRAWWPLASDDGVAEAALIACYAERKLL